MNAEIVQDIRLAVRGLTKVPGFTLVSLATLALGVAASATAFSILHAVLLRPLPYPEPDRLVSIAGRGMSTSRFERWRQSAGSYDLFAAVSPGLPNVDTADGPERIQSLVVSREFFAVLGLPASSGRVL